MDSGRAWAMHEAHSAWVREQVEAGVDGSTPNDRPNPSDYSQHFADMEAPASAQDELHNRLRAINGMPPLQPMAGGSE